MTGATTAQVTLTSLRAYGYGPTYAIYDTSDLWLLYDYAIDPKPLTVAVYTDTGNPATTIYKVAANSFCQAQTVGAGGYGSFTPLPSPNNIPYHAELNQVLPLWSSY